MFKRDQMTVKYAAFPAESFALHDGVAFMSYTHDGIEKLSLNCWVDFVDFEDSEIIGGTEVYALIWGLKVGASAFRKKGKVVDSTDVSFERDEDAEVSALFFAGEFHRVVELQFETTGQGRFQVYLKVQDVTGQSDAANTEVWIDGKIRDKACELSYPQ